MSKDVVGFIGGGNMAEAIIAGMLAAGTRPDAILISEPVAERRALLAERYPGIDPGSDNAAIAARCDCIVLAVKPQVLGDVCLALRDVVQRSRPLVISIAAGVRTAAIDRWLGGDLAIARFMPTQPALLGR